MRHHFNVGLFTVALMTVVGPQLLGQSSTVEASNSLRYVRGYSVQGTWLCYGFSNGVYHCTEHWYRGSTGFVSRNTPFVPSQSQIQSSGTARPNVVRVSTTAQNTSGQPCHETVRWPAHIGQWTVPLGCYGRIFQPNPAHYPSRPSYGWCNWWPEVLHPTYSGYTALHLRGHATPKIGAVVFFGSGVQGASAAGHYAQVVAIAPRGTWVLVTEMNFSWRGGGFRRVDYRFIHTGPGVTFRY